MNNKKIYDIKLIKQKLNNAMVLIEEVQNLAEEFPQLDTSHLMEALDNLEQSYYEVKNIQE